jgi:hypothetical protein
MGSPAQRLRPASLLQNEVQRAGRNKRSALRHAVAIVDAAISIRSGTACHPRLRLAAFVVPPRRAGGAVSLRIGRATSWPRAASASGSEAGRRNALRSLRPTGYGLLLINSAFCDADHGHRWHPPLRAKSRHVPRAATEEEQIRGDDLRVSILNSKCRAPHGCVSNDEPKLLSGNQHDGFRYRGKKRSLCGGILDYPHVSRRLRSVASRHRLERVFR